jgi:hypothetical protein
LWLQTEAIVVSVPKFDGDRALLAGRFSGILTQMPILGSHLSIAGGYYKAVESAHAVGCDCVQWFAKS